MCSRPHSAVAHMAHILAQLPAAHALRILHFACFSFCHYRCVCASGDGSNVSLVLRRPAPVALRSGHPLEARTLQLLGHSATPHTAVLRVSAALRHSATTEARDAETASVRVEWRITSAIDAVAVPGVSANTSHIVQLLGPAANGNADADIIVVNTTLRLPSPRLWWPNGYGEQHLYVPSAL